MTSSNSSRISAVRPLWAVEGGLVTIAGTGFVVDPSLPRVFIGGLPARLATASPHELTAIVPAGLDGGHTPVRIDEALGETAYVEIGAPLATGLHQVDSPAFDADGNLYVTFSGSRGQEAPVSIFRVTRAGTREPFVSGIVNATSLGHGIDAFALPFGLVARRALCYDLSYGAAAFAFLAWARAANAGQAIDGLGMLVEQAAESFAIWHGVRPETDPVYAELRGELRMRATD